MLKKHQTAPSEDNVNQDRLYLGIELSREKWKLGFSDGKVSRARIVTITARDWEAFGREVEKARRQFRLDERAAVRSC
jgi:hypothetical protein